jgi:hypothetical protein
VPGFWPLLFGRPDWRARRRNRTTGRMYSPLLIVSEWILLCKTRIPVKRVVHRSARQRQRLGTIVCSSHASCDEAHSASGVRRLASTCTRQRLASILFSVRGSRCLHAVSVFF